MIEEGGATPDQAAVDAVAHISERDVPRDIALSSGVELHLKKSPPFVVQQAVQNIERPEIPTWHNPQKGRDEPNPADPEYEKALLHYASATGNAIINALFLFGVDIVKVPKGLSQVEDQGWVDELEFLGLETPKTDRIRRLLWLKTVALTEDDDIQAVTTALFAIQGIGEEDVAKAVDSFRSGAERGAHNVDPPSPNGADGHPVSRVSRRASASSRRKRRRSV